MTTIKATVRDGRLELAVPGDWPDGTEVEIHPVECETAGAGPMSPEEIAQTLAAMDAVQPFEMTPEEEARLGAERLARKEWEKAHFAERAEKLRGIWE